jgi:hypothetical protein
MTLVGVGHSGLDSIVPLMLRTVCYAMTEALALYYRSLGTASTLAGHRSVRVGFGHPTRVPWVFEISTYDSNENVENRQVLGGSDRVFLVGLDRRIGYSKVIFI